VPDSLEHLNRHNRVVLRLAECLGRLAVVQELDARLPRGTRLVFVSISFAGQIDTRTPFNSDTVAAKMYRNGTERTVILAGRSDAQSLKYARDTAH
jgi:hypothetical protein